MDYAPEPIDTPAQKSQPAAAKPPAPAKPAAPEKKAAPAAPAPAKAEAKTEAKTEAKAAPKADAPAKKPEPAPAAKKPAPAAEGDENTVLRGASAAVVKNMNASLDVPTPATSVRAIPAKAMIDNRVVINNHLKRTRGGKISFTHLLGYAIVQAVKKFPNLNRHFAEVDGKPNVVTPAHTNLGLAIDLPGKDGNRTLVVGGHQALRNDAVRPVHRGLRGHRAARPRRQAHRRGLHRRHHLADQPGHHRHRALGAPPHARPGRDHRRRRHGVPGRVPGRQRGTHRRARRRQADHPDVDL